MVKATAEVEHAWGGGVNSRTGGGCKPNLEVDPWSDSGYSEPRWDGTRKKPVENPWVQNPMKKAGKGWVQNSYSESWV